ncbi:MAG: triose-phosphate isomerase [Chloroflexota bacterium]
MSTTTRRPIIVGNWKMNGAPIEARALALAMLPQLSDFAGVESVLCPPFLSLTTVREVLGDAPVKLGAQDAYDVDQGAFTGAVSAAMLAGLVDYVILGHSERRHIFGEGDDVVARKVQAVLRHGLTPIICVGEQLEDRDAKRTTAVVRGQLQGSLAGVNAEQFACLVVAYEPVWAIGTGRAATADQAQEVAALIRSELTRMFGPAAAATRVQYGGSVTPANCRAIFALPDIDGALVGGASLKPADFVAIVENCAGTVGM